MYIMYKNIIPITETTGSTNDYILVNDFLFFKDCSNNMIVVTLICLSNQWSVGGGPST